MQELRPQSYSPILRFISNDGHFVSAASRRIQRMRSDSGLHAIPNQLRPWQSYSSYLHSFAFCITFNLAIFFISVLQIFVWPLSLPFLPPTARLTHKCILQFTKSNFGLTTVWISEWFGPTEFVVTAGAGVGDDWIQRTKGGKFVQLNLPERGIWVSSIFLSGEIGSLLPAEDPRSH